MGDHVFYVQEMAADDARRVLAQRLYVLNGVPKREQAIMTQLDFNEPGELARRTCSSASCSARCCTQDLRVRAGLRAVVEPQAAGKGQRRCRHARSCVCHHAAALPCRFA